MQFMKQDDLAKLILRLSLGLMIFCHGIAKIQHLQSLDWIGGMLASHGVPSWVSYGVLVGELVAPVMLVIGYFTRIGALIIVINMMVAVWLVHLGQLLKLGEHGGWSLELQGFYFFTALALVFLGGGKYSVHDD